MDLLPDVPIPVFAFDQLSLGEAFEAEGSDVHGFGRAVQDQLDQAGACRGRGLETGPAQPAGQVETVQPRGAVDGPLVGGDAIPSHVDRVQAALFDLGDALDHLVDQLFEEGWRGRLVLGTGWFAAQGFVFAGGQDQRAALRAVVAVDDVVDRGRELPERRRTVEESHIVSPGLERDFDPSQACDLLCPRSSRVDDDGRFEIAFGGADAGHASTRSVDGSHFAVLNKARAVPFGRLEKGIGSEGRVGVAGVGFVGREVKVIGHEIGEEFLHLRRRDDRGVDPDPLLVGDVATQLVLVLPFGDLHKARVDESAITADSVLPIIEVVLVTDKGQFGFSGQVVVHADESAGVTGRARSRDFAFEDGGFESALGEVEGEAGAHHPGTDDDGIICWCHVNSFLTTKDTKYHEGKNKALLC
jgi:hypothetical protein